MMEYGTYPAYKPSNVGWLGDIPDHWMAKRLKFLIREPLKYGANEAAELTDPELPRYIRITDVRDDGSLREETFRSLPQDVAANYLLSNGDILLARSGATVGKSFIYKPSWGVAAYAGYLIRARISDDMNADFAYLFLQSDCYWQWLNSVFIQATIQNVSAEKYANLFIPIPPIGEQGAIARFLDFKTAQIDALIAKKKILLDKLAEKRTALISHAVTKGLDPSVPMKNSGVTWLGDIPAHWDIKRLKFVGKTRYGLGEPPQKLDGGIPFIRATDIYRGEIDGAKVQTVDPDCVPWSRNPTLKAKDILVVRSGAYTGDSAIVPAKWEGSIAGYDMVYTAEGALPEYIALNLLTKHVLNGQIYLAKNRAAQPHLNAEELGDVVIALPPPDEQVEIVAYIEEEAKKLAIQCDLVISVVEHLHEYRSSLITNAITGRIDVRDFEIPQSAKGLVS